MKRFLIRLMTLVALVVVANTAFAVEGDAGTPYAGSTHTYTLGGIGIATGSTATATVALTTNPSSTTPDLAITGNWSLTAATVNGSTVTPTAGSNYYDIALTDASTSIAFDLSYDEAMTAGTYYLWVEITDAGGCSNYIRLPIDVTDEPTWDLAITGPGSVVCQNTTAPGDLADNTQAISGTTTFDYTVAITDTYTGGETPTFDFDITLSASSYGGNNFTVTVDDGTLSGSGTSYSVSGATGDVVITVEFTAIGGQAQASLTATVDNATMDVAGGTYDSDTASDNDTATIGSTPAIGGTISF